MKNSKTVDENLVNLIAKIGEKITIGRAKLLITVAQKTLIIYTQ